MRMFLKMQAAGPVLYAEVSGELRLERARPLYRQVLDEYARAPAAGIIIDCRQLRGTLTPLQRYELGVHLFESQVEIIEAGGVPPRIVIVALPPLFDRGMLMESVAVNRGAQFRAVESLDEAAQWLGVEPSLLPGG